MKYRLYGIVVLLFFLAWRTLDGLVEGDWGRLEGGLSNLSVFFSELNVLLTHGIGSSL